VPLVRRIAPAGGTREALAPLTVEGLRLAPDTLVLLRRLGLKTIGQLYPLPRSSLKRRLSSTDAAGDVLRRLDQALGIDNEPGRPLETPPRHAVRRAFEEPLISSEGLMAALEPLSVDLCRGLDEAQRGARRLRLLLYRVDGTVLRVAAGLSAPSRTPAHIIRLIGDRLARIDVGLGIDALILEAPRTQIFAHAQSALAHARNDEEDVARLIDQLTNRLGGACVSRLKPLASHLPERAERHVAAVDAERGKEASDAEDAEGWHRWRSAAQMPRPPLLLASPEPITVMAEIPEGPPVHFSWRRVMRRIVRAEGPERIAPEWWLEIGGAASRTRDYYRVEDEAGGRYWLFREGLYQERGEDTEAPPRWYLHGLYG
jgi:protein ImuB